MGSSVSAQQGHLLLAGTCVWAESRGTVALVTLQSSCCSRSKEELQISISDQHQGKGMMLVQVSPQSHNTEQQTSTKSHAFHTFTHGDCE